MKNIETKIYKIEEGEVYINFEMGLISFKSQTGSLLPIGLLKDSLKEKIQNLYNKEVNNNKE